MAEQCINEIQKMCVEKNRKHGKNTKGENNNNSINFKD